MSNESVLVKGALTPTLILGAVAMLISSFTRGLHGFYGALLAQCVVVIYFVIHLLVSKITRSMDPIATMAIAMFSYFTKLLFLAIFFIYLAKFTSRETIDRTTFGATAIALTIAWLGGEVRTYLNLKTHLPLPNGDSSKDR